MLFGAPFDSTTSYRPGARFASRTMRAESYGLETYSPYQDLDLDDAAVFDGGDLELCFWRYQQGAGGDHGIYAQDFEAGKAAAYDWRGTPCHTGGCARRCRAVS